MDKTEGVVAINRHIKDLISFLVFTIIFLLVSGFYVYSSAQEYGNRQPSPLVTNVFYETDIREALRDLSAQTGVKIIPDETVQGIISVELKETPLEDALKIILAPGGYVFRRMPEGYYLVGSAKPSSPSFNLLTTTEYIKPNYIKAKDVPRLVSSFFDPYIQINEDTNTLTITASPDIIARFRQDLAKIDQPPRQIMIEALVVELSEEGKKSLGVIWGPMTEEGFSVYPPSDLEYSKMENKGSYTISGTLSYDFLLRLNTLISQGKAKIRANPRVATLEGREAQIYIGKEEWYLINVGTGTQAYYTLQSIPTGVVLKITPYVADDKEITVMIAPEVSEVVGKGATNLPVVTKRTASTVVRVNDGETIAIGGLLQEESREIKTRTPLLGSIPFVGGLFRHKKVVTENKEAIIFITPHLMEKDVEFLDTREIKIQEKNKDSELKDVIFYDREERLKDYYSYIAKIIRAKTRLPRVSGLKESKEIVLEFTISSDGEIKQVSVIKSSGNSLLDSATIQAIKSLSYLPPFPEGIDFSKLTFSLPIRYERYEY